MVVPGPLYALQDVLAIAATGKVTFSRRSEADYQALGFSKEGAIQCICSLVVDEYRTSLQYDGLQPFDDYLPIRFCPSEGRHLKLYIKLRIPDPSVVDQVYVTSFHLPN